MKKNKSLKYRHNCINKEVRNAFWQEVPISRIAILLKSQQLTVVLSFGLSCLTHAVHPDSQKGLVKIYRMRGPPVTLKGRPATRRRKESRFGPFIPGMHMVLRYVYIKTFHTFNASLSVNLSVNINEAIFVIYLIIIFY